jgi:hypothetical protein
MRAHAGWRDETPVVHSNLALAPENIAWMRPEAHYALDNLTKCSQLEYQTVLPDGGLRGKNLKDADSRPRMMIEGY